MKLWKINYSSVDIVTIRLNNYDAILEATNKEDAKRRLLYVTLINANLYGYDVKINSVNEVRGL